MKKKTQISAQIFIYLMAVVIIGVILLVGYKSITTLINNGKLINIDNFKKIFEQDILTYAKQYNSQKKIQEKLPPNGFDEICIADSRINQKFSTELKNNPQLENYPLIKVSIENDADYNIFLLNKKKIIDSFYIDKLDVLDNFICINKKEKKEVWIRGTGKVAELYTR